MGSETADGAPPTAHPVKVAVIFPCGAVACEKKQPVHGSEVAHPPFDRWEPERRDGTPGSGTSLLEVFPAGRAARVAGQKAKDKNSDEKENNRVNRDLEGEHWLSSV